MNKNLAFWGMTISTIVYLVLSANLSHDKKILKEQIQMSDSIIKYQDKLIDNQNCQIRTMYKIMDYMGNPYDSIGVPQSKIDSINELMN